MKRSHKFISLILGLALTLTAAPISAFAADDTQEDEYKYYVTKQRDDLYLIGEESELFEDGGFFKYWNSMSLVIGKEKAAVIDTGCGYGDLIKQVRDFTDLPLVLILTHYDGDHIGGAYQFQDAGYEIYMNPDDYEVTLKDQEESGHHFEAIPLNDGDVIDLGGTTLEAILVKGHTDGSTVLWDKAHNSLYTGDAINRRPWVFLQRGVPLEGYLDDMMRLFEMTQETEPTIYCNHSLDPFPYRTVSDTIIACQQILLGKAKGIPYIAPWVGCELYENTYEYMVGRVRLCYHEDELFFDDDNSADAAAETDGGTEEAAEEETAE